MIRTPIVERSVDLGDVWLNVASAGSGRPVVLLHGFPDSWRLWRHQIRLLAAAGHRVIAPDLRGFGRSSRPSDVADYRTNVLVGDLTGLLDSTGVERAAVVGHDWGAVLAWRLAGSLPQRVDRLVAVSVGHPAANTSGAPDQQERSRYLRWFLPPGVAERMLPRDDWRLFRDWGWHGAERNTDPNCDRQIDDLSRPGALTAGLNWYRANLGSALSTEQHDKAMAAISCPTMGVWSTGDQFLTEAQMTRSEQFVTGPWRYERLTCDHWVPVHAADELGHLLLDFLS